MEGIELCSIKNMGVEAEREICEYYCNKDCGEPLNYSNSTWKLILWIWGRKPLYKKCLKKTLFQLPSSLFQKLIYPLKEMSTLSCSKAYHNVFHLDATFPQFWYPIILLYLDPFALFKSFHPNNNNKIYISKHFILN